MLSWVEVQVSVKLMGICTISLNFNWAKNLLRTSTSILVIVMVNVKYGIEWFFFVLRAGNLIEEICNFKRCVLRVTYSKAYFRSFQSTYSIFTLDTNVICNIKWIWTVQFLGRHPKSFAGRTRPEEQHFLSFFLSALFPLTPILPAKASL